MLTVADHYRATGVLFAAHTEAPSEPGDLGWTKIKQRQPVMPLPHNTHYYNSYYVNIKIRGRVLLLSLRTHFPETMHAFIVSIQEWLRGDFYLKRKIFSINLQVQTYSHSSLPLFRTDGAKACPA